MRALTGCGVLAMASVVSTASAAPVAFPGSGTSYVYSQNFDAALGSEWTLDGWGTQNIFTGGTTGVTAPNISGTAPDGVVYPLTPKVAPSNLTTFGFAGKFLTNNAKGSTTATAKVEFNNLPNHTSIDLGFLLAVGDSIDSIDTPLIIKVDGVEVFNTDFSGGGGQYNNAGTGVTKTTNLSTNGYYREKWNAGAVTSDDRTVESWTLETVYDFTNATAFNAIAHTSDTLTIEFIHGFDQAWTDEFAAFENVSVTLNGVIPTPASLISLLVAAPLLMRRR
jgi:hypothetical protein